MEGILSYVFFFLGGLFLGICDTLCFHFKVSIFKNLKSDYWNPFESAGVMKNFLGIVRLDPYHLSKYLALFCFAYAAIFYKPLFQPWYLDIIGLVCSYGLGFEIFFSKLLKSK